MLKLLLTAASFSLLIVPGQAQPTPAQDAAGPQVDIVLRLLAKARAVRARQDDQDYPIATRALQLARQLDQVSLRQIAEPLTELLMLQARSDDVEHLLLYMLGESAKAHGAVSAETLDRLRLLGRHYHNVADYGEAERYRLRALATAETVHGREHPIAIALVGEIAKTLLDARRAVDADVFVERHLESSLRALGAGHPESRRALLNRAALLQAIGDRTKAEPLLRQVADAIEADPAGQRQELVTVLSGLAVDLATSGRVAEAEPLIQRASRAAAALPLDHRSHLEIATADAFRLAYSGFVVEADLRLSPALENASLALDHPDYISISAALASIRLANPEGAHRAYEMARRATDGFNAREGRDSRRSLLRTSSFADAQAAHEAELRSDYFELLADASWAAFQGPELGPPFPDKAGLGDDAFNALQLVEASPASRAMINAATRRAAEDATPGLGALVRERQEIAENFQRLGVDQLLAASLSGEGGLSPRAAAAERERLETRMAEIDDVLRRDFRRFFNLVQPGALFRGDADAMLADDEAVLMIAPTPMGTHIMVLSRQGLRWDRSELTSSEVKLLTRRLLWDAGANIQPTQEEAAAWGVPADAPPSYDRAAAFSLYSSVIAPVAPALAGKRHVFVYSTGPLSGFPLGMLVTQAPTGRDDDPAALRSTHWFADAHALSVAPSLQALYLLRQQRRQQPASTGPLLQGFGDPLLSGETMQRGGRRGDGVPGTVPFSNRRSTSGYPLAEVAELRRMSRLPGTAVELEAIRTALAAPPNAIHLRQQATERLVRAADLSSTSILIFATHGLLAGDIKSAFEPGLVLTPPGEASEEDDGLLTASEIAGMRINADWVILSACNTAAGDGSEGAPALSGLARAFFHAGARGVLASHWPVQDDVAAQLTVRTIELQRQGQLSRAEALQRAMREIREESTKDAGGATWAHPNAWAPFSLIGDGAG